MQQIDLPDDRADAVDRVRELLARGVRVAGVEAEADLDTRLRAGDRLPEQRERVEAPGHGVLAPRRVLYIDRDLGLEHLERARPAAHPLLDPVLGVPGVDDHGGSTDVSGRV